MKTISIKKLEKQILQHKNRVVELKGTSVFETKNSATNIKRLENVQNREN